MFVELIAKLIEILQANNLIKDTFDYEKIQTDTDPYVVITPSGNEAAYSTNEENVRVYAFVRALITTEILVVIITFCFLWFSC